MGTTKLGQSNPRCRRTDRPLVATALGLARFSPYDPLLEITGSDEHLVDLLL